MARKNRDGKHIIAAGEVGQFTVCPESWKLRVLQKIGKDESPNISEGERLHFDWSKNIDRAAHLGQGLRFLIALIITTLVIVITN